MSGDSPNSHRNEIFDFKEGRVSPGPTTSKDPITAGTQSTTVVQASVIVEPDKDKDDDEKVALCSPILNNPNDESRVSDADKTVQLDELSYSGKKKGDDKEEKKKLNGDIDKLDGVWIPSQDTRKKPMVEEEDENCAVKCLYYTMQCCECVIV